MRLASESAEEEEIRLSRRQSRDRAKRAVQSSQATKNCRGSETAEARERTDSTEIEERGVSIQKARRKRTHDIAIIHVSSCNDVQEMSLATFRIELGLHSMCMSRLHALYFMLRTPMTLAPRSVFSFFACSVRSTVIRVFFQTRPHTVTKAVDDLSV